MVKEAIYLAKLGFAVFPLAPNTKLPTKGSNGVKDAAKDGLTLHRLFTTKGRPFNVGLAMGMVSGIVGIDLDHNHGATEEDLAKFPRTVTVKTRNGYHLYYKINRVCKKGALIGGKNEGDNTAAAYLRSDGHYFVAPPSVVTWDERTQTHQPPWEYRYHADAGGELSFGECPLADLPEWCYRDGRDSSRDQAAGQVPSTSPVQQLAGTPPAASATTGSVGETSESGGYPAGLRHDCFVRTAVSMRKRGRATEEIRRVLLERNQTDFIIPKESAAQEIDALLKWVEANVKPLVIHDINKARVEFGQYVLPLGHRDDCYFYTTSSNKMIIRVTRSGHTENTLLDMMPMEYWMSCYPKRNKDGIVVGFNALQAASDLMEACRDIGIYSDQNVRGVGCWEDQDRLVYHTGDKLLVSGQHVELNGLPDTHYLYALRPSVAKASNTAPAVTGPLTVSECSTLLEACQAIKWRHEQSALLFAGGLALARLCGALAWRPHLWLTGPAGCGKSSILEYVAAPLLGDAGIIVQGETTAAGIRQALESDSKPVLFDEAETSNERSSKRMQHILELARQASFENEGRILKGTADGSGHSYKITSMFLLASIRVNLIEEADISRFAVLELGIGDSSAWPEVRRKLSCITKDFGDRLHARMMSLWPVLRRNIQKFEDAIAATYDRRSGQQYGTLLAGWWALCSDDVVTDQRAAELAGQLKLDFTKTEESGNDERDCIDHMMTLPVSYDHLDRRVSETYSSLINKATVDSSLAEVMHRAGMDATETHLFVATQHGALQQLYRDTKWGSLFHQALARLPGAERCRHRFGRVRVRAISIPLTTVFHQE